MSGQIRILGLTGSLRRNSFNRSALRAAAELLRGDAVMEIADLSEIPFYNEDVKEEEGTPEAVNELADKVRAADAIVICTPEYNFSVPPVLKNALDWISREEDKPLSGKLTAIMSASPGMLGGSRVQYHLRQICVGLDMQVLNGPEVFIGGAHRKFDENGVLADEGTENMIAALLEKLLAGILLQKRLF